MGTKEKVPGVRNNPFKMAFKGNSSIFYCNGPGWEIKAMERGVSSIGIKMGCPLIGRVLPHGIEMWITRDFSCERIP